MNEKLESLLDLYGADLTEWPDRDAAQDAREAALRSIRCSASSLTRPGGSTSHSRALSSAIERSPERERRLAGMQAALLETIEPQAQRRRAFSSRTLMRLAASVVVACGLGIGVGQIVPDQELNQPDALDQLLLGSVDGNSQSGDG